MPRAVPRRYSTLAGAVLLHLTFGTVSTSGNLIPYLVSYMRRYVDASVDHAKIEWVAAASQMSLGGFSILGGFMVDKLGIKTTCLVGCVVFCYNMLVSYSTLNTSYLLLVLSDGIGVGMGVAVAYTTSLYAAVEWFPLHRGVATGFVTGSYYLGYMFSMLLQTSCLNPLDVQSTADGYFEDEDLLMRVPWLFPWTALGTFIIQMVGLWCMDTPSRLRCPLLICVRPSRRGQSESYSSSSGSAQSSTEYHTSKPKVTIDPPSPQGNEGDLRGDPALIPPESKGEGSVAGEAESELNSGRPTGAAHASSDPPYSEVLRNSGENNLTDSSSSTSNGIMALLGQPPSDPPVTDLQPDLTPREMWADCRFRIILPTYILNSVVNIFIITSYKSFAETIVYDDTILTDLGCLGALSTVLGSVIWGIILDKTSYKTTMLAITSLLTVLMGTLPLACHYWHWAFTVWGLALYFCAAGNYAIMPAVISAAYGPRHAVKNMAVLLMCRSLSALLVAVCLQFFLEYGGYYGFCSIQALLTFFAMLLTVAFPDQRPVE